MFDITTIIIFGVVLLLGYWLLRKPSKFPPGPSGSSMMRLLLTDAKKQKIDKLMLEWTRTYKDIFAFKGSPSIYMITNLDWMKKVFVQNADHFSNRPSNMWLVNKLTKGKGIIFNPRTWKQTRKFALHSMRDFGLGKHSLDDRIQEEAKALVEQFHNKNGQTFDPQEDITKTVSNIICSITFGKRYKYDDPEFAKVLENLDGVFRSRFTSSPLNTMPKLRYFGFFNSLLNVESFEKPFQAVKEFVREEIRKHRETYDPDDMRDLVDLYVQAEKNDFKDMKGMDEENLFQVIVDLFLAGTDTTTATLRWLLLHLINNLDAQKKCQTEIKKVMGNERIPEYRERNHLPYTIATIQEAIRLNTVAFGTLQHVADKPIELGGYVIPEGSHVHGLTIGLMYDSKIWGEDVEMFRPGRWFDEEGQLRNIPEFIPFGLGRRACPGEQLARNELFIDTVALLQKFTFRAEDPENPPKIEGSVGATFSPHPFKLIAVPNL